MENNAKPNLPIKQMGPLSNIIRDAYGKEVCILSLDVDYGEYIVKAVNCYETLLSGVIDARKRMLKAGITYETAEDYNFLDNIIKNAQK